MRTISPPTHFQCRVFFRVIHVFRSFNFVTVTVLWRNGPVASKADVAARLLGFDRLSQSHDTGGAQGGWQFCALAFFLCDPQARPGENLSPCRSATRVKVWAAKTDLNQNFESENRGGFQVVKTRIAATGFIGLGQIRPRSLSRCVHDPGSEMTSTGVLQWPPIGCSSGDSPSRDLNAIPHPQGFSRLSVSPTWGVSLSLGILRSDVEASPAVRVKDGTRITQTVANEREVLEPDQATSSESKNRLTLRILSCE